MNPYEALGVPRDADAAAVKRAYRARAHKAHPDRGGKAEEFHQVQLAYDVLSDPERRKRFDEGGGTAEAPDQQSQVMQAIAGMVLRTVTEAPDLEHTDVIASCRRAVVESIQKFRERRQQLEATKARQEKALARFKKKTPGRNMLAGFVEGAVNQQRLAIEAVDRDLEVGKRILEVLDDYTYQVEPVNPADPMANMQYAPFQQQDLLRRMFGGSQ